MKLRDAMNKNFSEIPKVELQRSRFDRTSTLKSTFDGGYIIPIYNDEVLPGDTFVMDATMFARLITPITPIMDNLTMTSFWFFVPLRLLWTNFKKFMGEQDNPGDSTDFTIPQVTSPSGTGWPEQSLGDYMGLPILQTGLSTSALYMRAYNLIYKEWFRDQDLQDSPTIEKGDGPDDGADYALFRRGKRHDYFTSCRPNPQKGDAIDLPLTGDAPVTGIGLLTGFSWSATDRVVKETDGTGTVTYLDNAESAVPSGIFVEEDTTNAGFPNIRADLSGVTATTINDLREAFALQKMAEKDARGGTRYIETVKNHFGVSSPDARQQRPEYLGGRTTDIKIMQVEQTSEAGTTPQGTLASFGTITNNNDGFAKSFTEHGIILGLVSVNAELTYQQGIERAHSRLTKFDYYWPTLAHLGEQPVLNKEIFADSSANDLLTFGYQERWAEYRYKNSQITGKLRSTSVVPLDIWHLSQEFGSLPTLSDAFIQDTPPIDRITAITDQPHIIYDSMLNLKCTRAMPVFSVPGQIDRF